MFVVIKQVMPEQPMPGPLIQSQVQSEVAHWAGLRLPVAQVPATSPCDESLRNKPGPFIQSQVQSEVAHWARTSGFLSQRYQPMRRYLKTMTSSK